MQHSRSINTHSNMLVYSTEQKYVLSIYVIELGPLGLNQTFRLSVIQSSLPIQNCILSDLIHTWHS